MEFNFTLKDNNRRMFRRFVWFLFFLHVAAACVLALKTTSRDVRLSVTVLLGFYAVITTGYFFLRKKKTYETFSFIMGLLYANFWLKHVGLLALIIYLVLYVFVLVVQGRKTTVHVSGTGVSVTRVFKTIRYGWTKIDNVILKDNLLTIDLNTNKIIQAEIENEINEEETTAFNTFCGSHVSAVSK